MNRTRTCVSCYYIYKHITVAYYYNKLVILFLYKILKLIIKVCLDVLQRMINFYLIMLGSDIDVSPDVI